MKKTALLAYTGTRLDTEEETNVTLREVLLDSKLVFSKPQDRLFAGQIDRMDRFALRYRARKLPERAVSDAVERPARTAHQPDSPPAAYRP
ncbi:RNA polymerase-associated protein rapA [Raoultella planticola]|uniref:RNA polymerase-associated protein rapA n=1 Tax=Raoultella planticola TaxID=575 RepID=A0A485B4P7_RAOPL|nr:RNA polymerase-associated protein rapA [Raoultella planticola]